MGNGTGGRSAFSTDQPTKKKKEEEGANTSCTRMISTAKDTHAMPMTMIVW